MKYSHQFCSICEIVREDTFSADPPKAYIFYANHIIYVLQKKSRNKICLESYDTYVLIRTFFSQVYNKLLFLRRAFPFSRTVFRCSVPSVELCSDAVCLQSNCVQMQFTFSRTVFRFSVPSVELCSDAVYLQSNCVQMHC